MEIVLFYIPFGSAAEAAAAGEQMVAHRLAACANIFPIDALFIWEGQLQNEKEYVLLLKTIPPLKEKVQSFVNDLHSYDTPAILSWTVDVNEAYGFWMLDQIQQKP